MKFFQILYIFILVLCIQTIHNKQQSFISKYSTLSLKQQTNKKFKNKISQNLNINTKKIKQNQQVFEQPALNIKLTVEELQNLSEEIINQHQIALDEFASIQKQKLQRKDLLKLLDQETEFQNQFTNCYFPMYISTDQEIRKTAGEVQEQIGQYLIESSLREDMFEQFKYLQESIEKNNNKLNFNKAEQRYIQKTVKSYIRSGLDLPYEQKQKLEDIEKQISQLEIKFSKNLNEDNQSLQFTKEELKGLDDSYLENLQQVDGKYIVSLKYPEIGPLLQKCQIEETRKKMDKLNGLKGGPDNYKYLEEVLKLRRQKSQILGYQNFADFRLENNMAKNKETVFDFLNDLKDQLTPLGQKELQNLEKIKNKYLQENNQQSQNNQINSWDYSFYTNIFLEKEYQLDNDLISEYFPLETVTEGIFQIYQQILGLKFQKIDDFEQKWHKDVQLVSVYDQKSNQFLGTFYLDMHPREGKFGHAAVFPLQSRAQKRNGKIQHPSCAMLCNFTKPTKNKPSLLKHKEVQTFFHEFGHVMHNICTKAKIYSQSGTSVERDFVEAPSQMLENWTFEKIPLDIMSGHYKNQQLKLPENLLQAIINSRNVNSGLSNLRQIFFALYDMEVHTNDKNIDSIQLWKDLKYKISMIKEQEETKPPGGFGHIMGGYEAGYYGYLWSQVYSFDMYENGFKKEPMNQDFGLQYRKYILSPGGSKDSMDQLIDFLGREPNSEAFLNQMGLNNS